MRTKVEEKNSRKIFSITIKLSSDLQPSDYHKHKMMSFSQATHCLHIKKIEKPVHFHNYDLLDILGLFSATTFAQQ